MLESTNIFLLLLLIDSMFNYIDNEDELFSFRMSNGNIIAVILRL